MIFGCHGDLLGIPKRNIKDAFGFGKHFQKYAAGTVGLATAQNPRDVAIVFRTIGGIASVAFYIYIYSVHGGRPRLP